MPAFRPRDQSLGIGCCTAISIAVRGRDFGAGGGIDFFDDDGKLGRGALPFVVQQGAVDLAQNRIRGQQHPRLERLEQVLAFGVGRVQLIVVRRTAAVLAFGRG
ncbi:MAG: hypothetical protein AMJ58_12570 [Gammaproteobacteria bacterium SG8_30]|nr:MAG: hypothetical protein AMJ58_12570 [Gammaproteobacteria bacterium SG8_30]